jgi:catechol 2,3-dioxygenase-like lactoylglutathione lyase family enzyme
MLTGIDHVIIGVRDLDQAATLFTRQSGLAVSGGGIHPSGGTANRIIVIGESYLELITVHVPEEAQTSMLERLARGEGYLNFVLASDAIEADCCAMRERGITILGPARGELRSPDGRSRAWLRADVERPDMAQHYPFLIQHDSSGEERRFRLAGWQQPPEHALGAVAVVSVTLAVADLQEATRRFQHIYGLEPGPSFTGEAEGWEALLTTFPLGNGGQRFELAAPLSSASKRASPAAQSDDVVFLPEPGSLARHLERFGESLCRMTLAVADLPAARRYLEAQGVACSYGSDGQQTLWIHPRHTCGASIVLQPLQ